MLRPRFGANIAQSARRVLQCNAWRSITTDRLDRELAEKAASRDREIRAIYDTIQPKLDAKELDEVRRKRLIYRSKQRGWLEVDILLGSWAAKNVPHLNTEEMDDYEAILNEETIDIFNFVSGKDPLPDRLKGSRMMKVLQEYAIRSGVTDPARYKEVKTETNLI